MIRLFKKSLILLFTPSIAGFLVFHGNFSHAQEAVPGTTTTSPSASREGVPARLPYVERMQEVPVTYFNQMDRRASSVRSTVNPQHRPGALPGADPAQRVIQDSGSSRNWGTTFLEHSTAAVGGSIPKLNNALAAVPSTSPYNRSGKLYMVFSNGWGSCTASLVGKGVLVTAAHCLATYQGGPNSIAKQIFFVPSQYQEKGAGTPTKANTNIAGPYGSWEASKWITPTCYTSTAGCQQQFNGVVGSNDIAIVLLKRNASNQLPWAAGIGYYGYGWNGFGWGSGSWTTLTQIGYPGALGVNSTNRGVSMIRTDSPSYNCYSGNNTDCPQKIHYWGSQQTPGCSGGPNIINFGNQPSIVAPATVGSFPNPNIVTGATSFGNFSIQRLGSSYFGQTNNFPLANYTGGGRSWGAGNIGALLAQACGPEGGQAAGQCR